MKAYIYKGFERFWHWSQFLLVTMLVLTGFEIRGYWSIFGFENAVIYHDYSAYALLVLIAFAIFWHFTTGEWKQYIPTAKYLKEMVGFYMGGIFKGAPHPVKKTEISKLNPLQRLTYLFLKIFLFPVQIGTGIFYMYYNEWAASMGFPLQSVANLHIIGAFLFLFFLVVHIYLTTTGTTVFSNIKAMITGYEELEHDEEPAKS